MSRSSTQWMPFYVADYLADTTRLNTLQHGAYMLLLMELWRNGPIPLVMSELAAITRTDEKTFEKKILPALMRYFTINEDGGLDQKRINFERKKAQEISDKRRAAVSQRKDRKRQKTAHLDEHDNNVCSTNVDTSVGTNDSDLNSTRARNSHNHNNPLSSLRSDCLPSSAQDDPADAPLPAKSKPPKRGSRLPEDWQPAPELVDYANDRNLNPQREAEDFRDYWHARAGAGGVKLDWSAVFRTWCRKSADRQKSRFMGGSNVHLFPRPMSQTEQNREASMQRILARQEARYGQ